MKTNTAPSSVAKPSLDKKPPVSPDRSPMVLPPSGNSGTLATISKYLSPTWWIVNYIGIENLRTFRINNDWWITPVVNMLKAYSAKEKSSTVKAVIFASYLVTAVV